MKLIVVGMRFQRHWDYIAERSRLEGTSVRLIVESNSEGYNGKAVGVYHESLKLGYVRNADLKNFLETYPSRDGTTFTNAWFIESVRQNYLILELNGAIDSNLCSEINSSGLTECSITEPTFTEPTKETKMNTTSMRDSFFREVKNVAIDIQSGKFGVASTDGIAVYNKGSISVNPIVELGVKIPAFAVRVPVANLAEGDIILTGDNSAVFFVSALETGGYTTMSTSGEMATVGNVTNLFFGANSVLAVRNIFGNGEAGAMNPLMMAMFMSDDKSGKSGGMDMKTLMMMSMMSGGKGMDPSMLMMMALAGK